ncbi:unnamed protein product [Durusdinium trenchii]|uniref:Copia protein n=1 Tax=Durusdinium trenchii TaxID=1381693 RepID=A0ABP0HMI0_9DINO
MAASSEESGTSSWYRVPTWSGNPAEWRTFRREMNWWIASLDSESCKKFNVAARWALRQHGVVRARCEEFDPSELVGIQEESMEDPETKEKIIVTPADPFAGLTKLMDALEATVGKSSLDRKGELRAMYYQEIKRNAGERISAFCTRFRTLAADLKREGIAMPEEELGWMLKERLGLDPIRKQLLETALAGRESYDVVETECLRLFRDLHTSDPLYKAKHADKPPLLQRFLQSHNSNTSYRSPSSATRSVRSFRSQSSASASSRPPFRRFGNSGAPPRQALVTELPEDAEQYEPELEEDTELIPAEEASPQSIEEVLQAEAEYLASEIQELEDQGCEASVLEELESGLEQAAESLVTMREARSRIAEVKKDRGYGKAASSSFSAGKKPHGNQVPKQKANTRCFDCGEPGHWAGDSACAKPGAGLEKKGRGKGLSTSSPAKQVRVTEALNTEHLLESDALVEPPVEREVMMLTTLVDKSVDTLVDTDVLVDQSVGMSLKGQSVARRVDSLVEHEVLTLSAETFGLPLSEVLAQSHDKVAATYDDWLHPYHGLGFHCAGSIIGIIVGERFLSGIGAVMSFARKKLRADLVNNELHDLGQLAAGHFTLPLPPTGDWMRPGTQRWRSFGQDGVVEMQLNCHDWWNKKLLSRLARFDVLQAPAAPHEHLVTERSLSAMAQAMTDTSGMIAKWRRMVLRQRARAEWHGRGLLLWLLQRPHLRYAPFPYPSISNVKQWEEQAVSMTAQRPKAILKEHYTRSCINQVYETKNLVELGQFRNRVGLQFAFVEDSLLQGMLAARANKGITTQLKKEAFQEAQIKAAAMKSQEDQEAAVRQLIGPKGGLPSLKADLIRLAALLNVTLDSKMTNEQIKAACRPMIAELMAKPKPSSSSSKSSTDPAIPASQAKAKPTSAPQVMEAPRRFDGPQMISVQDVHELLAAQDQKFQTMLNQVMQHVTSQPVPKAMAGHPILTGWDAPPDETMEDGRFHGWTPEEIRQMNADHIQEDLDWRMANGIPPRQAQLISEAWNKHCRDRRLVSLSAYEVNEIYAGEWEATVNEAQNDVFLTSVVIGLDDDTSPNEDASQNVKNPSNAKLTPNVNKFKNDSGKFVKPKTFMSEIYTTTQRVTKAAQQRGHVTGSPLSLETGWNFLRSHDREVARKLLSKEIPYFLVIAFPCSFWSILLNLNPPKDHERRLKEAMQLLRFAIQLARDQHARGLHFVLENPQSSRAWSLDEMQKALSALQARLVDFHQCRFGLRGRNGQLVRKATRLATSSDYIVQTLDGMKCLGNHDHEHVIGGAHISRPSGHYPWELAKTLVKGMERQFEADFKRPHPGNLPGSPHSTLAVEEGEAEHYPAALDDSDSEAELPDLPEPKGDAKLPAGVKLALKRLHENTGHRSGKRLARALAIAGAPADVVRGALHLRCSICDEQRAPKARRPTSLPTPKDVGDQVFIDIFEVFDLQERRYYVVHAVDFVSRLQMAELVDQKSSDMGIIKALVKAHSVSARDDMDVCIQEAVAAYNSDMTDAGVTPNQAAFGRQPRLHGDTLGDFGRRLSERGLIESKPSLARQVAIRESARIAMLRMHFSKGLRRAETARSRTSTIEHNLQPGQIVYFYRQTRYNNKTSGSKKRLSLRRWHGPALLIALEGHTNGFVSYRGQLTKCALEHLRAASTMEQVATSVWEDAIQEVIEAACHDQSRNSEVRDSESAVPETARREGQPQEVFEPETPVIPQAQGLPSSAAPHDLPPLQPQEMVAGMSRALTPGAEGAFGSSTRRSSSVMRPSFDLSQSPFPQTLQKALLQAQERATEVPVPEAGNKRSAELDAEQLREEVQEADEIPPPATSVTAPQSSEVLNVTALPYEVMELQAKAELHPLRQLQALAAMDRRDPLGSKVLDHGTWRGDWPLPSRTTWQRMKLLGQTWPLGNHEAASEVLAVLTARKEKSWNSLTEFEKKEFHAAALKGWQVWTDNDAVEILPDDEAGRIRARLRAENQSHRILVPRYVMVDKNDGLRTETNQLPLLANARLVVPGYQDISAYGIRCDAPTASRTSQHLLLAYTASSKVKKGIFGLADSPRRWYQRLNKAVIKRGWKISVLDSAMWMLWSEDGSELEGIMLSHVDDLLMGGNERAQKTLESLGQELGFGSISNKSFVYCGKKIEQLDDGTISVSMEEYHSNLQQKVYSQVSYYVLLADRQLLDGNEGQFAILDARSHRLQRVCRSTFAAELLGIEEAMDAGQYCRGVLAEAHGYALDKKPFEVSTDSISMVVVTDSKDAYDKGSSSTPSYGSQKSLAFTVAWIRSMLARCNTMLRWTSTENLFVDCGTKDMDSAHLLRILDACRWSIRYSPSFVKQSSKGKAAKKPRFKVDSLPYRFTFACLEGAHALTWRSLEEGIDMRDLKNLRARISELLSAPRIAERTKAIQQEAKLPGSAGIVCGTGIVSDFEHSEHAADEAILSWCFPDVGLVATPPRARPGTAGPNSSGASKEQLREALAARKAKLRSQAR